MRAGSLPANRGISEMLPEVVATPIWSTRLSVNQTLPSKDDVIPSGPLLGVGVPNSVITPAGVIVPILLAVRSVNHILPSGPCAMNRGPLLAVGIVNSVT